MGRNTSIYSHTFFVSVVLTLFFSFFAAKLRAVIEISSRFIDAASNFCFSQQKEIKIISIQHSMVRILGNLLQINLILESCGETKADISLQIRLVTDAFLL